MSSILFSNAMWTPTAINDLFRLNYTNKQEYNTNIYLQVISIQHYDADNKSLHMYTATLRDAKYKHNTFIIKRKDSLEIKVDNIILVKVVCPLEKQHMSGNGKAPIRLFIIKDYQVEPNVILNNEWTNDMVCEYKEIEQFNNCYNIVIPGFSSSVGSNSKNNNNNNNNNNNGIISSSNMNENGNTTANTLIPKHDNNLNSFTPKVLWNPILKYEESKYTLLRQWTTFTHEFSIYVRVTKKSELRNFNASTPGKEPENSELQITCFNATAKKFFHTVTEGKVYDITGGNVQLNQKKYTTIKSEYRILLNEYSKIIEMPDTGILKANTLTFMKINEIPNQPWYSFIDVCGIVIHCSDLENKKTKNGDQLLRKIVIGDLSKYQIEVSLWRSQAHTKVNVGDIVICKRVKVNEFSGRNWTTFEDSKISVNPINPPIPEILEWLNFKVEHPNYEYMLLDKIAASSEKVQIKEEAPEISYIQDVLNTLNGGNEPSNLFHIKATVTRISHNEKNYYSGCPDRKCKKKLAMDESGKYPCPTCKTVYDKPSYYYTLSVRVKDCSCEYWIDIIGFIADSLMNMNAEEYKSIVVERDPMKLKQLSNSIEFKTFYFAVRPKLSMFNSSNKKKLYVSKIDKVNYVLESNRLMSKLKNVLK